LPSPVSGQPLSTHHKCLHRLLGIQGVAVEIETEDLTLVGLILECRGGGQGLGGVKQIEAVVGTFILFGSSQGDVARRLGSIDGARGWVLLGRLRALAMTRQDHKLTLAMSMLNPITKLLRTRIF
jgi:hypothetical protein